MTEINRYKKIRNFAYLVICSIVIISIVINFGSLIPFFFDYKIQSNLTFNKLKELKPDNITGLKIEHNSGYFKDFLSNVNDKSILIEILTNLHEVKLNHPNEIDRCYIYFDKLDKEISVSIAIERMGSDVVPVLFVTFTKENISNYIIFGTSEKFNKILKGKNLTTGSS